MHCKPRESQEKPMQRRTVLAAADEVMDHSMRMVIIAGVLMLALLIAIVGSVGADAPMWTSTASPAYPINPRI